MTLVVKAASAGDLDSIAEAVRKSIQKIDPVMPIAEVRKGEDHAAPRAGRGAAHRRSRHAAWTRGADAREPRALRRHFLRRERARAGDRHPARPWRACQRTCAR